MQVGQALLQMPLIMLLVGINFTLILQNTTWSIKINIVYKCNLASQKTSPAAEASDAVCLDDSGMTNMSS